MSSRYKFSQTFNNRDELYLSLLEERNTNSINQYGTQNLKFPTEQQINELTSVQHIWKQNDKFWKLSSFYYKNPNYWWVIAFFNKKPTDADMNTGDLIYIPEPLDKILFYISG
jgi:nucleoid-associated protein YgaU